MSGDVNRIPVMINGQWPCFHHEIPQLADFTGEYLKRRLEVLECKHISELKMFMAGEAKMFTAELAVRIDEKGKIVYLNNKAFVPIGFGV